MWALLPLAVGGGLLAWKQLKRDGPVDTDEGVEPPLVEVSDDMQAIGFTNGKPSPIILGGIANGLYLRQDAAAAYNRMMNDCPGGPAPLSAFRSNEQQTTLYELYRSGHGNLAAPPGYSNHQGGLSVDEQHINPSKPDYNQEKDEWLQAHCGEYGWKRDGLNFGEPWHMTFVG